MVSATASIRSASTPCCVSLTVRCTLRIMPNIDAHIEESFQTLDHQTFCAVTSFSQKTSSDSIVASNIQIDSVSFINSVKSKFIDAACLTSEKLPNVNLL